MNWQTVRLGLWREVLGLLINIAEMYVDAACFGYCSC